MTKKGAVEAHFTGVKLLITLLIGVCFSVSAFSQTSRLSARRNADPDFSASGYIYQSEPFREEKKSYTSVSVDGSYRVENSLRHKTLLGLSLDYNHIWTEYQDEHTSRLDEIALSARRTSVHSKNTSLTYGLKATLPANEADKTAGFNGSMAATLSINWKLAEHSFLAYAEPAFYSYTYKTANIAGDEYNKKMSLLVQGRWVWSFHEKASWRSSLSLFEYQNYANRSYQIYSFSSLLTYDFTKNIGVVGGIASNDRVITTNSVLADDVTVLRAGIEWSL